MQRNVSLINLILFYDFVRCFVLGIDIRPEIKIPAWFFACDYIKSYTDEMVSKMI